VYKLDPYIILHKVRIHFLFIPLWNGAIKELNN
jgi:hypothetical protein